MEVVLLGATGFLGARVLRALSAAGVSGTALVRDDPKRVHSTHFCVVPGALPDVPSELFPREGFVLVHAATKQRDDDGAGFAENVKAARALVTAMPDSCRGVVYVSSLSVYGAGPQRDLREDAPVRPTTALAASRAEVEAILREACDRRGIACAILRSRFVVGEGDRFTLPGLLRAFRKGTAIGDESQRLTIIGVDDYASVIKSLATSPQSLGAVHVGYRRPVTLAEIREALAERFPLPPVRRRVRGASFIASALSLVPWGRARSLGGTLELLAHDHVARVDALAAAGFGAIVDRDPRDVLRAAVGTMPALAEAR